MPLTKQVIFRVTNRTEGYDGTNVVTEVLLAEDNPQPDRQPIHIVLRDLLTEDAEQFKTGERVTVIVGADPAPPKATVVESTLTVMQRLKDAVFGAPDDPETGT